MWLWRRMLRISWMEKRTDNSILQELEIKRELPGHVRKRKLSYYGHLCRDHGCQITKTVVEGYVEGRRRRGRPRKQYIDNIKQWTQLTTSECVRAAEDRSRWKQLISQAMVADDHTWSAEKKKLSVRQWEFPTDALQHNWHLICTRGLPKKHFLFCSVLFPVLFCSVSCSVLFCSVLFCSVLFCSVLFCSVLFCSVLFCSLFHNAIVTSFMRSLHESLVNTKLTSDVIFRCVHDPRYSLLYWKTTTTNEGYGSTRSKIMDAVSDNYATTKRDRYICLTPKSNTKCFLGSPRVQIKCQLCWSASVGNSHCRTDNKQKKTQFIQFNC